MGHNLNSQIDDALGKYNQVFLTTNLSDDKYRSILESKRNNLDIRLSEAWIFKEIMAFIVIVLIIISLLGNGMVFFVLYRKKSLRTVTNILLINLSVAQIIMATVTVPINLLKMHFILDSSFLGKIPCDIAYFATQMGMYLSSLTLLCIAIDRYRVIVSLKERIPKRTIKIMIASTWIIAAVLTLINTKLIPGMSVKNSNKDERIFHKANFSVCTLHFSRTESYVAFINGIFIFITQYLLPLFIMLVLYAKIIHILWIADTVLNASLSGRRNVAAGVYRKKSVTMLIVIMILFFISWAPLHVFVIYRYGAEHGVVRFNPSNEYVIHFICFWIAMSNIWYNPIIYCWMNIKYRKAIYMILQNCCNRKRSTSNKNNKNRKREAKMNNLRPTPNGNKWFARTDETGTSTKKNIHQPPVFATRHTKVRLLRYGNGKPDNLECNVVLQ